MGVRQIFPDIGDGNKFFVYDLSARKLTKFDIGSILNNEYHPEKIIRIPSEYSGLPTQLAMNRNGDMLGIGMFHKGRISVYGKSEEAFRRIGNLPVVLKNDQFASQHSHGFIGNMAYVDRKEEIFVATRLGSVTSFMFSAEVRKRGRFRRHINTGIDGAAAAMRRTSSLKNGTAERDDERIGRR